MKFINNWVKRNVTTKFFFVFENCKKEKIIYVSARKREEDILTIDGYNSKMKFWKLISDLWRENTSRKLSL